MAVWQLTALGIDAKALRYRATVGRLYRVHRGVYAVGCRTLTRQGSWMAAVLAYGPDAVISHRTAAAVRGVGWDPWKVHVTTPQARRSRPNTKAHVAPLHPEDLANHDRIPVTSVARTMLDIAAHEDEDRVTRLIEDFERRRLFDLRALDRLIARRPHAPGVRRIRTVLADYRGAPDLRSNVERDFRSLIVKAGLPQPQFNVMVAGVLVDVHWPQWRLVVELDTRAFHTSPRAFERDRVRDAVLQKAGYRVLRITAKRLHAGPQSVLADILALSRL